MSITEEILDLGKKKEVYQKALDEIKVELSTKRSELSVLAKKTVVDLESNIPVLQSNFNRLTAEIERLEKIIKGKKEESELEKKSCEEEYQKLRARLESEYLRKNDELDVARKKLEIVQKGCAADRAELIKQQDLIKIKEADLEKSIKSFENLKKIHELEAAKTTAELNKRSSEVSDIKKQLEENNNAVISERNAIKAERKEANAILVKIVEIDEKIKMAKEIELANSARDKELNTRQVALMAESKRIALRKEDLENTERAISKREENIRFLEAKEVGAKW